MVSSAHTLLPGQDQEYVLLPVDQLHPHPDNPNQGDLESIQESIQENGWYGVVTVRPYEGEYQILAGEHRWLGAIEQGAEVVPCVVRADLEHDPVGAARILIADNATARRGRVDPDILGRILRSMDSIRGTGIDLTELEAFEDERVAAEEEEEAKVGYQVDRVDREGFVREYGVILVFDTEAEQEEAYNALRELGYDKIRVASI